MRLVLDWDGTVSEEDTGWMVLERFGDREVFMQAEGQLGPGKLTLKQVMELEFSSVRAPLEEVRDWLVEEVRIRPGFCELAERHRPVILSSGFTELIEPVLAREGLELEVRANSVEAAPDGWQVRWRDEAQCVECGEACKRGSLPDGEVVYVGDGYSDRCAALSAGRVFARDGLADYLEERGLPFEPFEDFVELAAAVEPPSRS